MTEEGLGGRAEDGGGGTGLGAVEGRGAETSYLERRGKRAGEAERKRRPGAKSIGGGGGSGIGVAELRERVDVAHRSTGRIEGTSSLEQRRNRAGEIVEKMAFVDEGEPLP